MVMTRHDLVYPILLAATASMGIGFGFTVPALNTIAAGLFPQKTDIAVLAMNAVLGLGTALAPVFIAIFVGVGWWWGLPTMVGIAISGLFLNCWHQPLAQGAMPEVASTSDPAHGLPGKFWVFAVFMILYGICETMNGTWATLFMTQHTGASATMASIALTAFWGMVTAGRVLFFMTERWLPERMVFRLLSVVVIAGFVLDAMATKKAPLVGITACALAGLGCSALLPLAISFSQEDMPRIAASVSGGLIACYQIGYGLAAFGVGMLHDHLHIDLNHLFATAAVVAVAMAIVAFPLAHASARQTAQRAV
jgi:fucose permease